MFDCVTDIYPIRINILPLFALRSGVIKLGGVSQLVFHNGQFRDGFIALLLLRNRYRSSDVVMESLQRPP